MAPGVERSPGPGSGDVVEQDSPSLIRESITLLDLGCHLIPYQKSLTIMGLGN
jgi:hypothetical protein